MTAIEHDLLPVGIDPELLKQLNKIPGVSGPLKRIYPSGLVLDMQTPGVHAGINLAMVTANATQGLMCFLQPFENMRDHHFDVYFTAPNAMPSGPPVFSDDIEVDSGFVRFYIPRALVLEGIYDLLAVVTAPGSGNSMETPRLRVKIDLELPAGLDPDPRTPNQHENLLPLTANLPIPGVIRAEDIAAGITLTVPAYIGMDTYDTIEINLGGVLVSWQVTEQQVGLPVDIQTGPADWSHFNPGPDFIGIYYRVYDETHNASIWSMEADFVLDLGNHALYPPIFLDADEGVIDLAQLPASFTEVMVPTNSLRINEVVTLHWRLMLLDGSVLVGEQSQPVVSLRQNLFFEVPGDATMQLAAGGLSAYYSVLRNNAVMRSGRQGATLIGELASLSLPAPIIREARNNVLSPVDAPRGATLLIDYPSMNAQDLITIHFPGPPGAPAIPDQIGVAPGPLAVAIPVNYLLGDSNPQITYSVARAGRVIVSAPLSLIIRELAAEHLPSPFIPQTNGGVLLNLNTFNANAQATIRPWPLILQGQPYWLYATFQTSAGVQTQRIAAGQVTAAQQTAGLSMPLTRAWLQTLTNQSQLSLSLRVALRGGGENTATVFPLLQVAVIAAPPALRIGGARTLTPNGTYIIFQNRPPAQPSPHASASFVQAATGGVPPYTYTSNNPRVATVDAKGMVVAVTQGSTVITARDSRGSQVSYTATVANRIRYVTRLGNVAWNTRRAQNGGIGTTNHFALTRVELANLYEQYRRENANFLALFGFPGTLFWTLENVLTNGNAMAVNMSQTPPNFNGQQVLGDVPLPWIAPVGW